MTPTCRFRVLPSSTYQRDVKKLVRRNKQLLALVRDLQNILSDDPYNRTKAHDITRLTDVKPGSGQYRIRSGDYRIRYDIFGSDVVLYSFKDRKAAY